MDAAREGRVGGEEDRAEQRVAQVQASLVRPEQAGLLAGLQVVGVEAEVGEDEVDLVGTRGAGGGQHRDRGPRRLRQRLERGRPEGLEGRPGAWRDRRAEVTGVLDQRERMAREADDEPVHRDRRQLPGQSAQELAALRARQASDVDDHRARHHAALLPRGEHQGDPRRLQPPGHEQEDLRRRLVDALRVVDDDEQPLALADGLEEAEDRRAHRQGTRGTSGAPRHAHLERLALHLGERGQPVRHGVHEVGQGREREVRLLLAAGDPHRPDRGPRGHALQQLGLPDPRLATHHRDPLRPARDEPVQRVELGVAPDEGQCVGSCHRFPSVVVTPGRAWCVGHRMTGAACGAVPPFGSNRGVSPVPEERPSRPFAGMCEERTTMRN